MARSKTRASSYSDLHRKERHQLECILKAKVAKEISESSGCSILNYTQNSDIQWQDIMRWKPDTYSERYVLFWPGKDRLMSTRKIESCSVTLRKQKPALQLINEIGIDEPYLTINSI